MTSDTSSVTIAGDSEEVEPTTAIASEKLPDPTVWQRLVGVVAGVAGLSVVFSLGMILIVSRVGPPFSWIPGFGILFISAVSFAVVRGMALRAFGANDEKLEMAKPLRWLSSIAVWAVAIAAMMALYVFSLMGTPMHSLQGDYGIAVAEASTARTPMGNELPSEADVALVESLIEQTSTATEGARVRAVSGNWNEALGYFPNDDGIAWMKEIAGYLDVQVENGAGCYQISTLMTDVADILDTDTGRAEYIVSGAMLAWSDPETIRNVMVNCA